MNVNLIFAQLDCEQIGNKVLTLIFSAIMDEERKERAEAYQ